MPSTVATLLARGARGVSCRHPRHPVDRVRLGGWRNSWAPAGAPIGIDVEGHGRHEELAADVDLSRTVGWFTTKYPVSLTLGELPWAQVVAGDAALGAVIKDAKEQLRALPDGLTYGLLRYLNAEVDLCGMPTRRSGSTIWAGWAVAAEVSDESVADQPRRLVGNRRQQPRCRCR